MRKWKRIVSLILCVAMMTSLLGLTALAEEETDSSKPYLVLGADLNESQLATVLGLLGVEDQATYLEDYNVSYTTNEEEYEYFGDYLDASIIGTKAYSSILLTPRDEGEGISVTTYNISYCTVEMYQNALITAGVSDVELVVAGPTTISGTAALVSAMRAYETMTGETLSEESVDAANNELVVTGELAEELGDADTAAELIAVLKNQVFANGSDITEADVEEALDEICEEMGVTLDEETRQEIIVLILKIADTDFDISALQEQASELFDRVESLLDEVSGGDVEGFFASLWNKIVSFFRSLFN